MARQMDAKSSQYVIQLTNCYQYSVLSNATHNASAPTLHCHTCIRVERKVYPCSSVSPSFSSLPGFSASWYFISPCSQSICCSYSPWSRSSFIFFAGEPHKSIEAQLIAGPRCADEEMPMMITVAPHCVKGSREQAAASLRGPRASLPPASAVWRRGQCRAPDPYCRRSSVSSPS